MTVITTTSHVKAALTFKNESNSLYFGFGHPDPWKNEDSPDPESPNVADVDKLIGMKKTNRIILVVDMQNNVNGIDSVTGMPLPPLDDNKIIINKHVYQPINDLDAYKYGARWIYIDTQVDAGSFPDTSFRQIGLYSNPTLAPNLKDNDVLLPADIVDNGILTGYDNIRKKDFEQEVAFGTRMVLCF